MRQTQGPTREQFFKQNLPNFSRTLNDLWLSRVAHTVEVLLTVELVQVVALMSTPMIVDPEISTQADGSQSSRVPVPLPEDPCEAIRQAYLDGTDTESKPFKDPVETETPETARMAVRVPHTMSPGLSDNMAEVAAMFDFAFRKRFRSSYESLPSSSPPDLPSRKQDEGPTTEDANPATGDDSLAAGDEGPGMGVESHGSNDKSRGLDDEGHNIESDGLGLGEEEEAVPESQQRAVPIVGTAVSAPLGLGYGALRHQELAIEEDHVYRTFEVGQGSGSVQEPEIPERVSTSR
ncbi:hypothetical protein Tco_0996381 [Tanacetum coccineum]